MSLFRETGSRNWRGLAGGFALAFLLGGFFIFNPLDLYRSWRAAKNWQPTPATVYEVEEVPREMFGRVLAPHYRVYYEYRVGKGKFKGLYRHADARGPQERDTITVLVNSDNPKQSTWKRGQLLSDAVLGLVCIVVGLWLAWKALTL